MAIPAIIAGAAALGGGIFNAISEGNRRRNAASQIRKNAEEMLRKQLESINQQQQFAQQGFEGGQKFTAQQARNAASGLFARAAQNRSRLLQQADAARRAGLNYDFSGALVNADDNIEQGVSRIEETRDASLNQSFQGYMNALQDLQGRRGAQQANYQTMLGQADAVEALGNPVTDFLSGAQTGANLATSGLNLASAANASGLFPEGEDMSFMKNAEVQASQSPSMVSSMPYDSMTRLKSYYPPQSPPTEEELKKFYLGINDGSNLGTYGATSPGSLKIVKPPTAKFLGVPRRAMGGMVKAGEPVIVGDNPDGTINDTTEMIVPMQNSMVVPGREAQEMQQSAILREQADLLIQDILNDKVLSKYFIGRYGKKKKR